MSPLSSPHDYADDFTLVSASANTGVVLVTCINCATGTCIPAQNDRRGQVSRKEDTGVGGGIFFFIDGGGGGGGGFVVVVSGMLCVTETCEVYLRVGSAYTIRHATTLK